MDKNITSMLKELVCIIVLVVMFYFLFSASSAYNSLIHSAAENSKSPNDHAVTPENIKYHGIGVERTIELLGGSVEEGVE